MTHARVITLLGAESTGKSTMAVAIAKVLDTEGSRVTVVPEVLRQFCDLHRRTPRQDEQRGIADEQTRRIEQAAQVHDIVVCDTSALMIAVYSEFVFGDRALYAQALQAHARCHHTLLMALDLPWQADGLQRDGPHVREPVDTLVRAALVHADLPFSVVHGRGAARVDAALASIRHGLATAPALIETVPR